MWLILHSSCVCVCVCVCVCMCVCVHSVVSYCLQPHRLQPTGLLCQWDFLGNNNGTCCFLSPGNLPNPGIKPISLASPELADRFFTSKATLEALYSTYII